MVNTYNLTIQFKRGQKTYSNISRTAVKYYIEWYRENPHFLGYYKAEHAPHKIR